MMKYILFFGLSGCATYGQTPYAGKGNEVFLTERIATLPERTTNNGGRVHNYFDEVVHKEVRINNPTDNDIYIFGECANVFVGAKFEQLLPAHTTQQMLIDTNALHQYEQLCTIK
jgi:hypothetical protein